MLCVVAIGHGFLEPETTNIGHRRYNAWFVKGPHMLGILVAASLSGRPKTVYVQNKDLGENQTNVPIAGSPI